MGIETEGERVVGCGVRGWLVHLPAISAVWLKTVPRAMAEGFTGGRSGERVSFCTWRYRKTLDRGHGDNAALLKELKERGCLIVETASNCHTYSEETFC